MDSPPQNLVSVIIPVRNRIAFIEEALQSVYNQSYRPIEILIINDGSTIDNSYNIEKIVKRFQYVDPNINLKQINNEPKGAPFARNYGFRISKGNYIQFFDSDDILLPDKLQKQVMYLERDQEIDLVYSKAQHTDEKLNRFDRYWGRKLDGTYLDYFLFSWQTMCALYKRSAIEKYGLWDETLTINQDWEFSLRYIIKGARVVFLDEVQSLFRRHSKGNIGSFSNDLTKIEGKWLSTQKIYNLLKEKRMLNYKLRKCFIKRWTYILLLSLSAKSSKTFYSKLSEVRGDFPLLLFFILYLVKVLNLAPVILRQFNAQRNLK